MFCCFLWVQFSSCQVLDFVPPENIIRWIWISASTTKRRELGVMGDESQFGVQQANCIAARFALLAMLAVVLGVYWSATWL